MSETIFIKKRDGSSQAFDPEKINETLEWACAGLDNVSPSEIAIKAHIQVYDGMKSVDLHKTLKSSAVNLITELTPDYQYVAGRLELFDLRKKAFGCFEPPSFYLHIKDMVELGKYDESFLVEYSVDEIKDLGNYINYDRDLDYSVAAMGQWSGKYLVQNRVTEQPYETPQQACMLISMVMFEKANDRINKVKEFYDALSTSDISLPTPIMGGLRTPTRQFSSCTLIMSGDSLESINGTGNAIVKYASQRAGVGINAGKIRAIGSPIRGGEAVHTGCVPFYKKFTGDLKSCSQGALRGASATLFYPFWHYEFPELIVLKNNKGVEENRERRLDYGVQFSRLFFKRVKEGGNITLFSPHDVEDLYEAFFRDQDEFERLYVQYENNPLLRKKTLKAKDMLISFCNERSSTGRIYPMFVDNANVNSPFIEQKSPIYQSNLCLEVMLPTSPVVQDKPDEGEVALCTLAAFNLGKINHLGKLERLSELLVEGVDYLLDYQDYPVKAAEKAKLRRSLGIGVINYSYYLAKNGVTYSGQQSTDLTHRLFEAIQYYLLKASCKLAKEKGECGYFDQTKYSQGKLPIDWYNKNVDDLTKESLDLDWEGLRKDIGKYGLRNSTVSAIMPSETSSQIANATNGIEPALAAVSTKGSKDGVFKMVVPEYHKYSHNYEFAWEMPDNKGYLDNVSVMQKFVDLGISANTRSDPRKFEGGKVPMKSLISDLFYAYKHGCKSLYYHNTYDGSGEDQDDSCESGACKI